MFTPQEFGTLYFAQSTEAVGDWLCPEYHWTFMHQMLMVLLWTRCRCHLWRAIWPRGMNTKLAVRDPCTYYSSPKFKGWAIISLDGRDYILFMSRGPSKSSMYDKQCVSKWVTVQGRRWITSLNLSPCDLNLWAVPEVSEVWLRNLESDTKHEGVPDLYLLSTFHHYSDGY